MLRLGYRWLSRSRILLYGQGHVLFVSALGFLGCRGWSLGRMAFPDGSLGTSVSDWRLARNAEKVGYIFRQHERLRRMDD